MSFLNRTVHKVGVSLKNLFTGEGHEQMITPTTDTACFLLKYRDLKIGYLTLENAVWYFEYSEEFKEQVVMEDGIKPLIGFSHIERKYESDKLWPFFSLRIPSLEQPSVIEEIAQKNIDKQNPVDLLRHFGRKTITDPFRLEEETLAIC